MLKRLIPFLLLMICVSAAFAQRQRTERYTGTMRNGLMEPGDVTYYYYKEGSQRIMHGIFRYRLRWRNDDRQRVYQTISGSMDEGLKSGNWSYGITVQDYFEDNQGYFYSYDIQLNAAYDKGIPHGNWKLSKSVKKRKQTNDNQKGWSDYEDKNSYNIHLVFDHGKLVDSVYFRDKAKNILISGHLDEQSMYHGKWVIQQDGIRLEETYYHGVVTHRKRINLASGQVEDESSLMVNKDMWVRYTAGNVDKSKLTFRPETLDILKNTNHPATKLINEHLFDYRFFLFSYIPGDKLIKDYPGKNPAALFSGMKKISFTHQINKAQANLLAGISREAKKTMLNYQKADNYARKNGVADKAKIELQNMDRIAKLSAKYDCLSGTIKAYMSVNEGINAAYENCNLAHPIEVKLPTDKSKDDLLKYIYKKVHEMHMKSGDLLHKVKTK